MAKVTVRVELATAKQPTWARNFLRKHELELYGNLPFCVKDDPKEMNIMVAAMQPFVPPVTLLYTTKHYWSFKWDSEAEQTMFILKWS